MSDQENWIALSELYKLMLDSCSSEKSAKIMLLEVLRSNKLAMKGDYYLHGIRYEERKLTPDYFSKPQYVFWEENRIEYNIENISFKANGEPYIHFGDFIEIRLDRGDVQTHLPRIFAKPVKLSGFAEQVAMNSQVERGAPVSRGYTVSDRLLFPEIDKLLAEGKAHSVHDATIQLTDRIVGGGNDESRAKRLARLYREKRKPT